MSCALTAETAVIGGTQGADKVYGALRVISARCIPAPRIVARTGRFRATFAIPLKCWVTRRAVLEFSSFGRGGVSRPSPFSASRYGLNPRGIQEAMSARRYTVVIADRSNGVMRHLTLNLRATV